MWLFETRMDSSLLGSSVHGIPRARILEWVAIPFSRMFSWPWDPTWVSYLFIFIHWLRQAGGTTYSDARENG